MKKILIFKQDHDTHKAGEIQRIGEASDIDSWSHWSRQFTQDVIVPEDLEHLPQNELKTVFVEATPEVVGNSEYWSNGEINVYDANDIPVIDDENGDPVLDPSFIHTAAIEHIPAVEAHYEIVQNMDMIKQNKMSQLKSLRMPLLAEADIQINKHIDSDPSAVATEAEWKTYRVTLRNVTEQFKDENGVSDSILEANLVAVLPNKPK